MVFPFLRINIRNTFFLKLNIVIYKQYRKYYKSFFNSFFICHIEFQKRGSIVKHSTVKYVFILSMIISGLFLCTISDNNGNPATTADDSNNVAPDVTETIPGLYADADSNYVRPGDTLGINIKVMQDTSITDTNVLVGFLVTAYTPRGWINTDSVLTDGNGRATIYYSDTIIGDKEVTLYAGSDISQTVRFKVALNPDQIQKNIEALPEQSSVSADSKSFTYINVKVINDEHNPIVGEYVQFITTAGVIAGENPPAGINTSGQSLTNEEGVARAKLTSSNINDTAYITVFLVSDRTLSDETQVAFHGVKINTQIDSSNIRVGATTVLTAEVLNGLNEPIANTPIFFSRGRGTASNLTISGIDSITGFDGKARVSIYGASTGTDTIIISSAGARSSTKINVTNLILTLNLDAKVLQASSSLFTSLNVKFTNVTGTPLANRKILLIRHYLNADNIPTLDTSISTTSAIGITNFTIWALDYEADMRLEIIGMNSATDIATAEKIIQFIKTRKISIQAIPALILANGYSSSEIIVQIKNDFNNPIIGDSIIFSTDAGSIPGGGVTNEMGKAIVSLTSDRRNTIATIKAVHARDHTLQDSITVEFAGVEINITASPQSINSSGTDTSTITIKLKDASLNPITGENVNFYKMLDETILIDVKNDKDILTNNRGEAFCKVVGTGVGHDTITVEAAGAIAKTVIYYSTNILGIDTIAGSTAKAIANGIDSTGLVITYLQGNGSTPIPNAKVEVSITIGNMGQVFAKTNTTNASGKVFVYMKNPSFANTATISALARIGKEVTASRFKLYFRADAIKYVLLKGSPEVISTNGDRSTITAIAFDSLDNRIKDAHLSFNIIDGPGGGEYIDPPTVITGIDGSAITYLVSGTIPSEYHGVKIVSGDFSVVKSDTISFTIAGPPYEITIRRNIGTLNKYESTYGKSVSALVTDVNGNPVADGTEVTFSLKISGYQTYRLVGRYISSLALYISDTVANSTLAFEDLNNNFLLDGGEDRNGDGMLNRGENYNGDRSPNGKDLFDPGPDFYDINWTGRRDYKFNIKDFYTYVKKGVTYSVVPAEPFRYGTVSIEDFTLDINGNGDTINYNFTPKEFIDLNSNSYWDYYEKLRNDTMSDVFYESLPGYNTLYGCFLDLDWNLNNLPEPSTAVLIKRTILTVGGIAENEVVYGQSDALRIRILINAESKGLNAKSPEEFLLPILKDDLEYWSYRDSRK